jgi:hypothetical protein
MQGLQALDQFKSFVSKIGGLGRYEDTYIVHAAEGETVVPMEVLDQNPVLKKRLFKTMMEMGIEPGRYIVGNELNSKNPITGQPEFFFKRIKKALADISGYAAPIIGAMYGPAAGALAGGVLGSFKRENPGDPRQGLQMALLGGGSGIASNLLGGGGEGTNFLTGRGLSGRYGTSNPLEIGKALMGMKDAPSVQKGNEGIFDRVMSGAGGEKKSSIDAYNELIADPANANVPQELLISEAEKISKAKTGILGGMSITDAAKLYGIGTLGLGLLIKMTSDDGNVGNRRDPYKPTGKRYEEFLNPRLDFATDMPIIGTGMAKGGVMDLQDGGESKGPGTGTSDSIPAMLSDGEFVMTAKAVRGAGGGDRREGARKMYQAMDELEAKA